MPAQLSKFSFEAACMDYAHPWTSSCASANVGLGLHSLQESLRIYTTVYIVRFHDAIASTHPPSLPLFPLPLFFYPFFSLYFYLSSGYPGLPRLFQVILRTIECISYVSSLMLFRDRCIDVVGRCVCTHDPRTHKFGAVRAGCERTATNPEGACDSVRMHRIRYRILRTLIPVHSSRKL